MDRRGLICILIPNGRPPADRQDVQASQALQASHNRKHIKEGLGDPFYASQERLREHWIVGEPPPQGLILGELPYAGKVKPSRQLDD